MFLNGVGGESRIPEVSINQRGLFSPMMVPTMMATPLKSVIFFFNFISPLELSSEDPDEFPDGNRFFTSDMLLTVTPLASIAKFRTKYSALIAQLRLVGC